MNKTAIVFVLALCAVGGAVHADTFYWKGGASAFGDYADPANWDVGSDGGGNSGNLVPGANDEIFGARAAMWNLGGDPHTIGTWNSIYKVDGGSDWSIYNIDLTNGTLNVQSRTSHNDTITVWGGASLVFPVGSTYIPSQSCAGTETLRVKANGSAEIRGTFNMYKLALVTEQYGSAIIDPTSFRIYSASAQTSVFNIYGTNVFPHGLIWTGGGDAACRLDMTVKWSGRLIGAGDFNRNGQPGTFTLNLAGGGSKIETCGDLSFSGMDSCVVSGGSVFIANAGHTLDISNFDFAYGEEGGMCYKYESGTLAIGASLPPAMQVNAGTIAVKVARSDLDGMTFAAGSGPITVRFDVTGCRLDGLDDDSQLSRVAFASGIDLSQLSPGITLFSSANGTIRAAMKAAFETTVPDGLAISESGDSLVLVDSNEIVFDTSVSSDLSNAAAWGGTVPVGESVTIKGGGTAVFNASSPTFAKITVTDGATLSIQGGTDESPVTPPPLAMAYDAAIVCVENSRVKLTNEIESVATPVSLPVFTVETNAALYAEAPEYGTKGFVFKNLRLNFFGTINLPDAVNHSTPCITFGAAGAGETAYFGLNVDGGALIVTNTTIAWQGNNSLVSIMCPEAGGAVHPVGEFTWRNFVKGPDSVKIGGTTILANSGYQVGVNNPREIAFTLNVSGTPICLNGTSTFAGGANIICTGADSGLVKADLFINYTLTQYVTVTDSAKITLRDGARFSNAFVVGSKGIVYFTPTDSGHISLELDGGRTEFYQLPPSGTRTAKVLVHDGCYDVGRRIPESTTAPEGGWLGAEYSPVFDRFAQIEVRGLFQIRATDAFNRSASWGFDGYWDHKVLQADMPFSGTGSILVTNLTANNSMTFTLVNKGNTMTGTIAAAPGTRSTLLFKNDCKWSGTVIANGYAKCTNADANDVERPAYVKFNDMSLEGDFPIRLWRSGGVVTNDFIEFSGVCTATTGGAFVGEPMEGLALSPGDSFTFASYPAASALPVNDSKKWRISAVPGSAGNVNLVLTYQPPGLLFSIR